MTGFENNAAASGAGRGMSPDAWTADGQTVSWIGGRPPSGRRSVGHPRARWEDDIEEYVLHSTGLGKGAWTALAQDREGWSQSGEGYVSSFSL